MDPWSFCICLSLYASYTKSCSQLSARIIKGNISWTRGSLHTTNTSKTPPDCSYLITAHREQFPAVKSTNWSEDWSTELCLFHGATQKRGLRVVAHSALWLAKRQLRVFTSQRSVSVFLINPQPQGGQAIKPPIGDAYSSNAEYTWILKPRPSTNFKPKTHSIWIPPPHPCHNGPIMRVDLGCRIIHLKDLDLWHVESRIN